MTAKTYFTADTHFGHAGVLRFCKRPFQSVAEMDEVMMTTWNAIVRPDDTIWHLGDFAYGCEPSRLERIFRRLHGRKHLLIGNHDDAATLALPWDTVQQIAEIVVVGQRLVLCHYAMRIWPRQRNGALHLFGHSHARFRGTSRSLDVGVDAWDFRPTELGLIAARLQTLPPDEPEQALSPSDA